MSSENIEEQIDMKCPKCGGIEFDLAAPLTEAESESNEPSAEAEPSEDEPLECAKCGHKLTYGELVAANASDVDDRVQKIGEDLTKQISQDLTHSLEEAIKKMGFGKK